MTFGTGPIAGAPIAAHPDEGPAGDRSLFQRLQDGEPVETVIVVRAFYRPVARVGAPFGESGAIAALPIAAAPDEGGGAGADNHVLIADGPWCGRPDDPGIANVEAAPRLIDAGSHAEEAPYRPETSRRVAQTTARLVAANGDGLFDDWFVGRTVDGQIAQVWLADDNGYARDWELLFEAVQRACNPGLDECEFDLEGLESYLDVPVLRAKYGGNGGASGDARLAGKYVPFAAGACFNVDPDLESLEHNIDRWHVGAILDVQPKEGGAPFIWDGVDHTTYTSLVNADVAPGYFTKALALGRTKRGGLATLPITGDVVAPHGTTKDLLLALARGAALLPEALLNFRSFGVLPDWPIDYWLKGDQQKLVSEVFDDLLRPLNGWYGLAGDRRLAVGLMAFPAAGEEAFEIGPEEIAAPLAPESADEPPRWRLGVTGARNWRPMAPSELVDWTENPAVSQADWERLQRAEETAAAEDSTVRVRHRGAIDALDRFGPTPGYWTHADDAARAAARLFGFLRRPMRRVPTAQLGLKRLGVSIGAGGRIVHPRLGLAAGQPCVVIARRLQNAERALEFDLLIAVDV